MDAREDRVLYLAVADGRGHLMRAHLLRRVLADTGLTIDVVTTSPAGQAFLAGLGTPAALLSGGFALLFDDRHRLLARRTERHLAAYLTSPRGLARDVGRLARLAAGARFIVNDSLHPAALALAAAPAIAGGPRVVNVHGDNLWRAAVHNFDGRAPDWTSGAFRRLLESVDARAFGRIVHSLAPADRIGVCDGPNRFRLPPLTAAPRRARAEVRRALGLSGRDRLAAIYLNPHFRDPRLAARLEAALAAEGIRFHGVSEPWAARPGWRAFDADFGTIVAASDLLVSGAGAAALEQARRTGVPLLALVGDQPEQTLNLSQARAAGIQARAVGVATDAPAALGEAIRALTSDAARESRGSGRPRAHSPSLARRFPVPGCVHKGESPCNPSRRHRRRLWSWKPTTWQAAVAIPTASSTASRGCSAICARRRDRWPRWMKWWSSTRGSRRRRRIACETWRPPPPDVRCDS